MCLMLNEWNLTDYKLCVNNDLVWCHYSADEDFQYKPRVPAADAAEWILN